MNISRRDALVAAAATALAPGVLRARPVQARQETWRFDNLRRVGGHVPRVEGAPTVVDSPFGKALRFDGLRDALFFDVNPLAGARAFTIEAYFCPGGVQPEPRWLYLGEPVDPSYLHDPHSAPRITFETRTAGRNWYLDAFMDDGKVKKGLIDPAKVHPVGQWYHVAQTYDGAIYRSYVNHQLEGQAPTERRALGPGVASVGVRINHENYFDGMIARARFTHAALPVSQLLPAPAALRGQGRSGSD